MCQNLTQLHDAKKGKTRFYNDLVTRITEQVYSYTDEKR